MVQWLRGTALQVLTGWFEWLRGGELRLILFVSLESRLKGLLEPVSRVTKRTKVISGLAGVSGRVAEGLSGRGLGGLQCFSA